MQKQRERVRRQRGEAALKSNEVMTDCQSFAPSEVGRCVTLSCCNAAGAHTCLAGLFGLASSTNFASSKGDHQLLPGRWMGLWRPPA